MAISCLFCENQQFGLRCMIDNEMLFTKYKSLSKYKSYLLKIHPGHSDNYKYVFDSFSFMYKNRKTVISQIFYHINFVEIFPSSTA